MHIWYGHTNTRTYYIIYIRRDINVQVNTSKGKGLAVYVTTICLYENVAVRLSAGCTICRIAIEVSAPIEKLYNCFPDMPAGLSHGRVIKPFLYYTGRERGISPSFLPPSPSLSIYLFVAHAIQIIRRDAVNK